MKHKLPRLLPLLIIIMLAGCTKNDSILENADTVMESNPQHAFSLLKTIDKNTLSAKDTPFYALLYTEAQINNGINIASDSLISIALKKYESEDALGMRTQLCMAVISKFNQDYSSAMNRAMSAYYIASQLNDNYWIAKSCEQISCILFNTNHYLQAAEYMRKSIENYRDSDNSSAQRKAVSNLARIYLHKGEVDKALSILDSLKNVCISEPQVDSALIDYIEAPRLIALINREKCTDLTEKEMDLVANDRSGFSLVSNPLLVTLHTLNTYDADSKIDTLLHKINRNVNREDERLWGMYALYEQAKSRNDYSTAIIIADSLIKLRNKVFAHAIEAPVIETQRNFIGDKLIYEKHLSKQRFWIIVAVIILALITVIVIIVISRMRMQIKRQELEINIQEINALRMQISAASSGKEDGESVSDENSQIIDISPDETNHDEINKESSQFHENQIEIIRKLFTSKWQTINALCEDYIANKDATEGNSAMFKNIEKEIKYLQSQTNFKKLELAIDKFNNGAMARCREDLPGLKENDYNMFALLMLRLSPRTISIFLNIHLQNFYLRRSRLRKKLSGLESTSNIQYYIELLK